MREFPDNETLMVWLINLFADTFPAQAILKGGMELRLLNCPRHTNDLDYVFVPFRSKKDIAQPILEVLNRFPELTIEHAMHSTCLRIIVSSGHARAQIEIGVASECPSQPLSTSELARSHHLQGRIVRVMSLDTALAHKLAAWLERGLVRDLYDVYFIREMLGVSPNLDTLRMRLDRISYQRGHKGGPRSMDIPRFATVLRQCADSLDASRVTQELQGMLAVEEMPGLELKLRKAVVSIADTLATVSM